MVIDPLDGAITDQKLARRLIPNAGDAGDVVHRIAHQRQIIRHGRRGKAVLGGKALHIVPLDFADALCGAGNLQSVPNELKHILIRRKDGHVYALPHCPQSRCGDQVIRLQSLFYKEGKAHGFRQFKDERHLNFKGFRRRLSPLLVLRIQCMSFGRPLGVKKQPNAIRIPLLHHFQQHGKKADNGLRRRPIGGRHLRKSIKSAKRQPMPIHQ